MKQITILPSTQKIIILKFNRQILEIVIDIRKIALQQVYELMVL